MSSAQPDSTPGEAARRRLLAAALCLAAALGLAAAGAAQEDFSDPLPIENAGQLTTVVNSGRLVTLPGVVERVALSDEALARVQLISAREMLVTGLAPGRSTLFVWLQDGRRFRYQIQSEPDLSLLRGVLRDLDPRIEIQTSGTAVVLRGEVETGSVALQAVGRTERLLPGTQVIDMLRRLDLDVSPVFTPDERLAAALREIDPRIRVRRIQVGPEAQPQADTYVLEGRVKNVAALVRAMTVAERQLGGTGIGVVAFEGGQGLPAAGFAGATAVGLAAQISRDLVITSPSGQVISFLEVDELPQILVNVRVMELDRSQAKRVGVNFEYLNENFRLESRTGPQDLFGGNVEVSFVDRTTEILAAIDFLETRDLARSVAEPNILTLSGEVATLLIGGQVPIPTTTVNQFTTVQSFDFQELGVRMSIRPTLIEGDVITLEVSPSITRSSPGLGVQGIPGFTFQNVQTTARVHAGQSLVLGGLLSFEEGLTEQRLPILWRLPIFRWRNKTRRETELLFVITPRLVEIEPPPPSEPIPPLEIERLQLPQLEWTEDRDQWREPFEPRYLQPEGVPPEFLGEPGEAGGVPWRAPALDEEEEAPADEAPGPVTVMGEEETADEDHEPVTVLGEPALPPAGEAAADPAGARQQALAAALVAGARMSVERAPVYDTSYVRLDFPAGDPGWERGAGPDVVVRAFRHAGIDLQRRLHEDVLAHPELYDIEIPDPSIDHRRVRHLVDFLERKSFSLATGRGADWRPGDLVVWDFPSGLHLGIVSDRVGASGDPLVIHHARRNATADDTPSEDDVLFRWPIVLHLRWPV